MASDPFPYRKYVGLIDYRAPFSTFLPHRSFFPCLHRFCIIAFCDKPLPGKILRSFPYALDGSDAIIAILFTTVSKCRRDGGIGLRSCSIHNVAISPPFDNINSYCDCLEVKRDYYQNCFILVTCYLFDGHSSQKPFINFIQTSWALSLSFLGCMIHVSGGFWGGGAPPLAECFVKKAFFRVKGQQIVVCTCHK